MSKSVLSRANSGHDAHTLMRRCVVTALAAGTLALAACGDDEPAREGAPPPDPQTQPPQTTPSDPPDDAGGGSFGY